MRPGTGISSGRLWAAARSGVRVSAAATRTVLIANLLPIILPSPCWAANSGRARGRVQDAGSEGRLCSGSGCRDGIVFAAEDLMSTSQERSAAGTFVERHGLWSEEQFEAAKRAERLI